MPCISFFALPLVARFLCGGRKGTFAHRVGQLSILALGFGSLAVSVYLVEIGDKAGWRSEGAGILFVMLAVPVFAFLALVFGAMFVGTLTREDSDEEDRFAPLRAGLAGLIALFVVVTAVRLWWLWR